MFQNFDKILQIPEKFYNPENLRNIEVASTPATKKDKNFIKTFNKAINETVEKNYIPKIEELIHNIDKKSGV
jgi:hypothetical protein